MSGHDNIVATVIAQQVLIGGISPFVYTRSYPRHLRQAVVTIGLDVIVGNIHVRFYPAPVAVPLIGIIEIGEFAGVYRDVHFFEGAG